MAKVTIVENSCKGCGLCEDACPKKVIKRNPEKLNAKGFHPATLIDEDKCISCAFCATMCPESIITVVKE